MVEEDLIDRSSVEDMFEIVFRSRYVVRHLLGGCTMATKIGSQNAGVRYESSVR